MREPVRDKGRLEHMLDAIDRVLSYMEGKSFDDLSKDKIEYYGIVNKISGNTITITMADGTTESDYFSMSGNRVTIGEIHYIKQ